MNDYEVVGRDKYGKEIIFRWGVTSIQEIKELVAKEFPRVPHSRLIIAANRKGEITIHHSS